MTLSANFKFAEIFEFRYLTNWKHTDIPNIQVSVTMWQLMRMEESFTNFCLLILVTGQIYFLLRSTVHPHLDYPQLD